MNEPEPIAPANAVEVTVKAFFEKTSPGKSEAIALLARRSRIGVITWRLQVSDIQLHCEQDACNGIRYFEPKAETYLRPDEQTQHFLTFVCRNCQRSNKTYAFSAFLDQDEVSGRLTKFGEVPPFGPPIPARLITLIGPDRDYFLKGRRSENQGLGIAAFAYYRRVVENQKARIIDEIIRVAQKIGAEPAVINDLVAARKETQFSTAVEAVKHGVPQSLLIGGNNPLTLLHSALSEGLHAQTDEECLSLATSIRLVLSGLVERMGSALDEEHELTSAVSMLLKASAEKAKRNQAG